MAASKVLARSSMDPDCTQRFPRGLRKSIVCYFLSCSFWRSIHCIRKQYHLSTLHSSISLIHTYCHLTPNSLIHYRYFNPNSISSLHPWNLHLSYDHQFDYFAVTSWHLEFLLALILPNADLGWRSQSRNHSLPVAASQFPLLLGIRLSGGGHAAEKENRMESGTGVYGLICEVKPNMIRKR